MPKAYCYECNATTVVPDYPHVFLDGNAVKSIAEKGGPAVPIADCPTGEAAEAAWRLLSGALDCPNCGGLGKTVMRTS